ncbi:flagellar basal-body MS-ring/collar protein FliF [Bacillus rubiinfantis]|uniref:flagellar basal-body MS-ring/collar protein FliF n=1 Tax=Bacillus rubiinfantis TaxID=1499680 RepID=UPI0005A6A9B7|nr:flagellar basal-body MS-ring/collar protein FliF [Bacillus rubiinfantis]
MNRSWIDQLKKTKDHFSQYWQARSKQQKWLIIGTFLLLVIGLSTFIFLVSRPNYVPLYTGELTQREIGDIKAELEKEGFTDYKISAKGTMLLVPEKEAPDLVVSLASAGYPKDNKINYDIFGENLSFGATDKQYEILEREAMQNEVANVLKNVDGIKNAEVILTLPEDSVFVRQDDKQEASASVVVEQEPGVKLDSGQVKALYTLVSKSVPNLPMDNITIMNQYSEAFELSDDSEDQSLSKYAEQRKIQKDIERDIQQDLQNLLGTILGTDKVYVHTFVKMNFDKVKTEEKLVEPAKDSDKGLVISSEKDSKTYTGEGGSAGGVVGSGETDVPSYAESDSGGDTTYEETQDKVNYELNRINKEIIGSPYQIEDITINVGVEPESSKSNTLSQETQDSIRNIVSNTVQTALGHPNLSDQEIDKRITIFPHTFEKNTASAKNEQSFNWLYVVLPLAGLLLAGGLIWFFLRRKKQNEVEPVEDIMFTKPTAEEAAYFEEEDMSVESQLKKLLNQRPDDFSKVIRTWLHDEEA